MLIKVHSYYSTTFVPGHFTPDSWGVPLQDAVQVEGAVNVIETKPIEISELGISKYSSLSLIATENSNIDLNTFIVESNAFGLLHTVNPMVSLSSTFTSHISALINFNDTVSISKQSLFSSGGISVPTVANSDISSSSLISSTDLNGFSNSAHSLFRPRVTKKPVVFSKHVSNLHRPNILDIEDRTLMHEAKTIFHNKLRYVST